MPIPPLALPGDYFLDGIRLVKDGETILDATAPDGRLATTIPIRVISEVFVTNVTSRPLSLDEIRGKGIVIDQNNFRAVNFQVAFNIDGTPFTINAAGGAADAGVPAAAADARRRSSSSSPAINQQLRATRDAAAAAVRSARPELLDRGAAVLPGARGRRRDPGRSTFRRSPAWSSFPGNVAFLNQFFSVAADGDQRRAGRHAARAARDDRHDRAADGLDRARRHASISPATIRCGSRASKASAFSRQFASSSAARTASSAPPTTSPRSRRREAARASSWSKG